MVCEKYNKYRSVLAFVAVSMPREICDQGWNLCIPYLGRFGLGLSDISTGEASVKPLVLPAKYTTFRTRVVKRLRTLT